MCELITPLLFLRSDWPADYIKLHIEGTEESFKLKFFLARDWLVYNANSTRFLAHTFFYLMDSSIRFFPAESAPAAKRLADGSDKPDAHEENPFYEHDELAQCVQHAITHKAQNDYLCEVAALEVMVCRAEVRFAHSQVARIGEAGLAQLHAAGKRLEQAMWNHKNCTTAAALMRDVNRHMQNGYATRVDEQIAGVKASLPQRAVVAEAAHAHVKRVFEYDPSGSEASLRRALEAMKSFLKACSERQLDLARAIMAYDRVRSRIHPSFQPCLCALFWMQMCEAMFAEQLALTQEARTAFDALLNAAHQHELSLRPQH